MFSAYKQDPPGPSKTGARVRHRTRPGPASTGPCAGAPPHPPPRRRDHVRAGQPPAAPGVSARRRPFSAGGRGSAGSVPEVVGAGAGVGVTGRVGGGGREEGGAGGAAAEGAAGAVGEEPGVDAPRVERVPAPAGGRQ